jgi:hypothetical protein
LGQVRERKVEGKIICEFYQMVDILSAGSSEDQFQFSVFPARQAWCMMVQRDEMMMITEHEWNSTFWDSIEYQIGFTSSILVAGHDGVMNDEGKGVQ